MSELLASYYGMEGTQPKEDLSGDIDSPSFDPEAFVRFLLQSVRQEDLLRRHEDMVQEVKKLDSDMQMLVYENYNRFISATDTIRTMKSNVDGMDSSMQELEKVTGRLLPCPLKPP